MPPSSCLIWISNNIISLSYSTTDFEQFVSCDVGNNNVGGEINENEEQNLEKNTQKDQIICILILMLHTSIQMLYCMPC